jgi:hypothetical protein
MLDTRLVLAALVAIVGAVIVGIAANRRGRNGPGWFLLAVIISPLIAGILVLALPRSRAGVCVGEQPEPEKRSKGSGILFAGLKWLGAAILFVCFVCLVVVAMFFLAVFLIVQHGGG